MGAAVGRNRACHPAGGAVNGMHLERWFDVVRLRLRSLLRRGAIERELDRELQFHLDQEIEANLHRGLAPSEARSAARRRIGGLVQIEEECRDMRHTSYIEHFVRDLQYAIRMLVKAPVFTLAAAATLALGIGANTAIFQLLDAVRLRNLPVREPHRLAQIEIPNMNFGILEGADNLSYALYQEIRANQQAFSEISPGIADTQPSNSGRAPKRVGCPCLQRPAHSSPRSESLPPQGGFSAPKMTSEDARLLVSS